MEKRSRKCAVVFLFALLHAPVCRAGTWKSTIVVSSSGTSQLSCGSTGTPCKTLDLAMQKAFTAGFNFTRIFLEQGAYKLEENYIFRWAQNLSIIGDTNSRSTRVEITCSPNVSLAFFLSENVQLQNLKLVNCGGGHEGISVGSKTASGSVEFLQYITALYFGYTKNLHITNIEVSRSRGLGLTLNDVGGIINITDSLFVDNVPMFGEFDKRSVHTGGGVFLLLNSFGHNPTNISSKEHDTYEHNNMYFFTDVRFLRNEAISPQTKDTTDTRLVPFSRGGGLGIYLFGNASGNTFSISRCAFVGNAAQWGGALQVEFKHVTEDNKLFVTESSFRENYASYAGGGARIGDITISKRILQANKVQFENCQFLNNTSLWGGGVSFYGTTFLENPNSQGSPREKFVLKDCHFRWNKGNVGSAVGVFLFNLNEDNIGPYVTVHVVLENSTIENNQVISQEYDVLIGQGAVYTVEVPIIFKGDIQIANNTNTAMVLDSAVAVVSGKVVFSRNRGFRGGALAMYGNSKIRFYNNSKLFFIGNECEERGGAMYIEAPGPPQVSFNATGYSTHQCFFEYIEKSLDYNLWGTEIVFQGNLAPSETYGLSVYATSLQNCRRVGETRTNNTVFQWRIVRFLDSSGAENRTGTKREVSTDPVNIIFNANDWRVAASEAFNASVTLLDEKGSPVYGMVAINIETEESANIRLSTPSSLFLVNDKTIHFLSLAGDSGDKFVVVIRSVGRHILRKSVTNLTLAECHPGYRSDGDQCVCSDTVLSGISRCGDDGKEVFLKDGYWAGFAYGQFHTVPCPVSYCGCPTSLGSKPLVGECTYNQSEMCVGDRDSTAVLCGKCKSGFTASFGSETCVENCSELNLLHFVWIFLVLLVLVMLLMMINVDVFTGYLNAWLYSYQVISLLTPSTFYFDGFMTLLIGLANLKLHIRFGHAGGLCFTAGLEEADVLIIMYTLPVCLILLVWAVAKVIQRFPNWCYSRRVKAPFSAFCIIFVLCYTNITSISLKMINPVNIGGNIMLFTQGELGYFQYKHLGYGLVAVLVIVVIVLPIPLLLIFQSYIANCLRCVHINVNNLKPLFDRLQSCFKDKYRWCAAFYFLSRLLILALDTFVPRSPSKRAALEAACVIILALFVYLRPYKEGAADGETSYDWINTSDAFLLTNLTMIAIFSSALEGSSSGAVKAGLGVFINVLAYVPLVVLVVVLYRASHQYYKNPNHQQHAKCQFVFAVRSPQSERSAADDPTESAENQTDYPSLY